MPFPDKFHRPTSDRSTDGSMPTSCTESPTPSERQDATDRLLGARVSQPGDMPPIPWTDDPSPDDSRYLDPAVLAQHRIIYLLEKQSQGHGLTRDRELMAEAADLIRYILGLETSALLWPVKP